MTKEEYNYITDSFSQIIDDIAGNPEWQEAAKAVAADLGTLEKELENCIISPDRKLDGAAKKIASLVCKDLSSGEEKDTIEYYAILAAIAGMKWSVEQYSLKNVGELPNDVILVPIEAIPEGYSIERFFAGWKKNDPRVIEVIKNKCKYIK